MKKHKSTIENYTGNLADLANELGDLRYDALANFLEELSAKLHKDGLADKKRNRVKLSETLFNASEELAIAKKQIDESWRISKPFMSDYE